jgi:hypothetical protein
LRAEWDLSVGEFKFESLLIKEAQESRTRVLYELQERPRLFGKFDHPCNTA